MQHRKRAKVTAALLALCMLVSLLPVTAFGLDPQSAELGKGSTIDGTGYHVTSVKNYSIAPDISERVIITNNDAGNSQTVANVMEVNTSGGRAKIVAGYGNRNPKEQGWTLKTTTDQAHVYEKESGLNVVGGVNASWFNINTGEPSGYLVMNGVVHHDSSSRAFIAAFDDGSVNVFREGTTLAQAEADQSAKQGKTVKILEAVDALVAMVWDGKVVITESGNSGYYPRTCVGIKADGTVVLFQADGTMAPRSVGYTAAEEARMMVALGCVAAIQLDEGGSSTYISQREGEQDVTMRNTPAGGSERVVSGTILVVSTVAASGEFDHAAVTPDDEYYTPRLLRHPDGGGHGLLRRCRQGPAGGRGFHRQRRVHGHGDRHRPVRQQRQRRVHLLRQDRGCDGEPGQRRSDGGLRRAACAEPRPAGLCL